MPRRRHFLHLLATSIGGTLTYSLNRQPQLHAQNTSPTATLRFPLRFFTEPQARTIAAAAARIFPTDASGPGASEANVVIYIDRQLASAYGRDRYRFTRPPFEEGTPEQGYQGRATPRDAYREGIAALGLNFHTLPPHQQDHQLRNLESTRFFRLLRQHVIEGMFADPMHGGNASLIGWQLIGFPGPYMSWSADMGRHDGRRFRPKPKSLAQIIGRPVTPWEDEQQ